MFLTTFCIHLPWGAPAFFQSRNLDGSFPGRPHLLSFGHDSNVVSVLTCYNNEDNYCRASPVIFPGLILSCGCKGWKLSGREFVSRAGVVEVEMRHCLGQISTLVCFECNKDNMSVRQGWLNTRFCLYSGTSVSILNIPPCKKMQGR